MTSNHASVGGEGHTPGPWFVSGPFIGPRLSADSGIQIKVARIAGPETDDESIANARLIAAAPDLLAALETVLRLAKVGPDDSYLGEAMEAGRAAIFKARGQ